MDFSQLWRDVRQNALVALAVLLLCMVVGWAAAFLPATRYTATTGIVAEPAGNDLDPSGAVAIIEYVLPLLPAEATDPATLGAAQAHLPRGFSAAGTTITASLSAGSGVVTVSATGPSASAAASYANAVAKELSAEQPANSGYKLSQLSAALPPSSPSNVREPTLIGATGFGVIAAVFAALAAAAWRRRLNKANEIRRSIGADVIVEIPRLREARPTGLVAAGSGPEAEMFQQLRSNLMFRSPQGRPFTVAVTSCLPSEGKTFVAANLAWVLASGFRGSIAVDCDVRRPALHTRVGVPFGSGLSGPVSDALKRISPAPDRPTLGVIPAGIPDRHPTDVIAGHLPQIMDEVTKSGRTVVIDCPPVMGTAETALIASLVDRVIVVVDARKLNPDVLQECLNKLQVAGAEIAGVVLNRVRQAFHHDWDYGYGYNYVRSQSGAASGAVTPPVTPARGPVVSPTVQSRRPTLTASSDEPAGGADTWLVSSRNNGGGESVMPERETADRHLSQPRSGEAPPELSAKPVNNPGSRRVTR